MEAGGAEVGVVVNGSPAAVEGNAFAAVVPVSPETTTLTALATATTGATSSHSVNVTVLAAPAPGLLLLASPKSGVAPLTVVFTLLGAPVSSKIELDLDGDESADFTGASLEGQAFTYARPGVYVPMVTVTDPQGNQLTAQAVIEVHDIVALDNRLQAKWTGIKNALRAGDVSGAAAFIHSDTRSAYQDLFSRFRPATLANIGRYMATSSSWRLGPAVPSTRCSGNEMDRPSPLAYGFKWIRTDYGG